MLDPKEFVEELRANDIGFFTGVPDSLLKNLCVCMEEQTSPGEHIIAANEGNAVAIASGYHLATGKVACVYMQNSGLGNALNPLTSLNAPQVYSIPLLLIIGWRGEPGIQDEPQHVKQGEITAEQLKALDIPFEIIDNKTDYRETLKNLHKTLKEKNAPVALLVRKDSFQKAQLTKEKKQLSNMSREEALSTILSSSDKKSLVVSTTGKTSREVYELRRQFNQEHRDFLTVGAMGHASSIALGIALFKPDRQVICLDGDGSLLMHMGAAAIIGQVKPKNFIHVLINNSAHESVGGQPTVAGNIDFEKVSRACGYANYYSASDLESLALLWEKAQFVDGPVFFEVRVKISSRGNLGRPTQTPIENKHKFMVHANA